jgi:cytochrome P450
MPWFGYPLVVLIGPEANRLILSEQPRSFLWRPALASLIPLLGEGLLVTDADLHDHLRRLVLPAFQRGRVDGYVPIMWDYATRYFGGWQAGRVLDLDTAMRGLTLQIAGRTLFGVDVGRERHPDRSDRREEAHVEHQRGDQTGPHGHPFPTEVARQGHGNHQHQCRRCPRHVIAQRGHTDSQHRNTAQANPPPATEACREGRTCLHSNESQPCAVLPATSHTHSAQPAS